MQNEFHDDAYELLLRKQEKKRKIHLILSYILRYAILAALVGALVLYTHIKMGA